MISENLALLKELDLETWKDIIFPIKNCLVDAPRTPLEQGIYEALVQAGVQRVIEKMGRQWQITSWNPVGELRYLASISNTSGLIVWDDTEGDSPADALLAAYIEAIQ